MNGGDLISVVMPCLNSERTLEETVASVLGQTYRNLELIVVDDGSTDSSREVLKSLQARDSRIQLIVGEHRGAGPARNRGIAAAKGKYVAFMDSDDSWTPDCLEKLHAGLTAAADAALSYCGWQNLGLAPQQCQPYIPPDYEKQRKVELFLQSCPWPIHAALVRKDVLDECGGFDEQWTSCMDFDLWLRLGAFRRVVLVPEVLAFYHHHSTGKRISLNRTRVALNHWRIQVRFVKEHPEIKAQLGRGRVRELIHGELLQRGFEAYWKRDLRTARVLFRHVMKQGYGRYKDWLYMLPSLLPESWHYGLIGLFEEASGSKVPS
jgi:glycosyltransferase involved in cell wall biosynthesis